MCLLRRNCRRLWLTLRLKFCVWTERGAVTKSLRLSPLLALVPVGWVAGGTGAFSFEMLLHSFPLTRVRVGMLGGQGWSFTGKKGFGADI